LKNLDGGVDSQTSKKLRRKRRNRIGIWRRVSRGLRGLPDYIILGAQKCGTTALYRYLKYHPTVAAAATKEIHYFDDNFDRGLDWYRAHFPAAFLRGHRMTGESSPSYLLHPDAPRRIAENVPDVKLIVLLRNPADRSYSHYHHNFRKGRETRDFAAVIDDEAARLAALGVARALADQHYFAEHVRFSYLLRGHYADQLERWFRHFHPERVLIVRSEDLRVDTARCYGEVLEFLGLPSWAPAEFRILHHYDSEAIDPSLRERLLEYFRPHNERLEDLLSREFAWD